MKKHLGILFLCLGLCAFSVNAVQAVTVDEYGNRAAVRVVFLSASLRERSVDHYRARYRKLLD